MQIKQQAKQLQTRSIWWVLTLIHRHIINLSHTLKVIKSSYWCVCACVYWLTGWMGVYPLTAPLSLSLSLRREERAALPCPRAGFHQWYAADGKGGRGLWPDFHVFQGMSSWVHCPYHSAVLEVTLELHSTTRLTLGTLGLVQKVDVFPVFETTEGALDICNGYGKYHN